jgi:hypothetical protein
LIVASRGHVECCTNINACESKAGRSLFFPSRVVLVADASGITTNVSQALAACITIATMMAASVGKDFIMTLLVCK